MQMKSKRQCVWEDGEEEEELLLCKIRLSHMFRRLKELKQ